MTQHDKKEEFRTAYIELCNRYRFYICEGCGCCGAGITETLEEGEYLQKSEWGTGIEKVKR